WFTAEATDDVAVVGGTLLGMGAGLGLAKLTTAQKGVPDTLGVLAGAGLGLGASAIADHAGVRLSLGDQAAGLVGLGYGAAWGTLLPSLGQPQWTDSRTAAGSTLLVSSLGAVGSVALAHATQASV